MLHHRLTLKVKAIIQHSEQLICPLSEFTSTCILLPSFKYQLLKLLHKRVQFEKNNRILRKSWRARVRTRAICLHIRSWLFSLLTEPPFLGFILAAFHPSPIIINPYDLRHVSCLCARNCEIIQCVLVASPRLGKKFPDGFCHFMGNFRKKSYLQSRLPTIRMPPLFRKIFFLRVRARFFYEMKLSASRYDTFQLPAQRAERKRCRSFPGHLFRCSRSLVAFSPQIGRILPLQTLKAIFSAFS